MTIKNLHQRKITAARLAEFVDKLAVLEATEPADESEAVGLKLTIAQTRAYITEFTEDLADFDGLEGADTIAVDSVAALGPALIRARVAAGLTQSQLAERAGLQTAAITRYEANDYQSAKLPRLATIANALDFDLSASLKRRTIKHAS